MWMVGLGCILSGLLPERVNVVSFLNLEIGLDSGQHTNLIGGNNDSDTMRWLHTLQVFIGVIIFLEKTSVIMDVDYSLG